jgi:hypothetical protein
VRREVLQEVHREVHRVVLQDRLHQDEVEDRC